MNDTIEVTIEELIAFAEKCWLNGKSCDGCSLEDNADMAASLVSEFFNVEIPKADPTPAPEPKPLTPLQEMLRDYGRQMFKEQAFLAPLVMKPR